ncbi:MAG: ComEC/Rec2 family competence protein [Bacteroidales bacterium]|nr:ComEC/Rec2 family competence protein [Bacteroidales bacterium]MCI1785406.1 ComEC/Rec2 family competence protein [Bacteroidales bacterium]
MTEGKEIEGIFVPYAAGILCFSILHAHITASGFGIYYIPAAIVTAVSILSALRLLYDRNITIKYCAAVFLLLGIQSAITNNLTCSRENVISESLFRKAGTCTAYFSGITDKIPFPSAESGNLIKALTTGNKSGLSKSVIGSFRKSGASHILALSGLHLGIIYLLLLSILKIMGNSAFSGIARYISIISACGFYSVATGASPSIVRAFLFILLNETAKITHRQRRPLYILFAALSIQLSINTDIIKSPGFQMSYMAMLGIFIIFPVLQKWYGYENSCRNGITGFIGRHNPLKKIWDTAALSISCQVFTAPVAWYYFGTFPKYFLITNLIALPMTTIIMILSIIIICLYQIGICPLFLIDIDDTIINGLLRSLDIISSM